MSFNFRDLIRKTNPTAAELRAAVTKLSVEETEAKVTTLEAEHRRLLIEGTEAEVESVEQNILTATRDVQRVAIAIEEFTARIADAETRESVAALDQIERDQLRRWDAIKAGYLDIHSLCAKLTLAIDKMESLENEFNENNRALGRAGRTDAKCPHPMYKLQVAMNRHPNSMPLISNIVLPGYYPNDGRNNSPDLNFGSLKAVEQ